VSTNVNLFLLTSTANERRNYQIRFALAIFAAIATTLLAGIAWWQRNEAVASAQEALTPSLAAVAPRSISYERHDERAVRLARQAYLIDREQGGTSNGLVTAALSDVLGTPYFSSAVQLPAGLVAVEISPSGAFVLSGTRLPNWLDR